MEFSEEYLRKTAEEFADQEIARLAFEEAARELNERYAYTGDQVTREMIDAAVKNFMRVREMRKSPNGKYRVIGLNKFDGTDWLEDEYDTAEEALNTARSKTDEAKRHCSGDDGGHSIATVYFAYDPDGYYIGGDTWKDE